MTTPSDADLLDRVNQFIEAGNPAYPVEVYDLIYQLACALVRKHEDEAETPEVRHTRLAIDELTDRLSDAISENIELSVQLRAHDEAVVNDNKTAAKKFMSTVLSDLFPKSNPFNKEAK